MDNRYDMNHNLENIVYNELIYIGYHINVYIAKDYNECIKIVEKLNI